MRRIAAVLLLGMTAATVSCSREVRSKAGAWAKGKTLSVKADFTSQGAVLEFQNESGQELILAPLEVSVWGDKTKKQGLQLTLQGSGPDAKLRVVQTGGVLGLVGVALGEFPFKLAPHARATWPPLGSSDTNRVNVVFGAEKSREQETFTVTR